MYHDKASKDAKYDWDKDEEKGGEKWYEKRYEKTKEKIPGVLRQQSFQHVKLIVWLPLFLIFLAQKENCFKSSYSYPVRGKALNISVLAAQLYS